MIFIIGAAILFLGLVASVFVVWYKLTSLAVIFCWVLAIIFAYLIDKIFNSEQISRWKIFKLSDFRVDWLLSAYGLSWLTAFYFLSISTSSAPLQSPWQTISNWYLLVFFLATVILGVIIKKGYTIRVLIFLVCAHSLLLHLYIPLSHKLPWGGDVWRHIGVESVVAEQKFYLPVLFGPEARWRAVDALGISLPEALLIPNKYAYGQLWGLSAILSGTFWYDLVTINIWLIPILWSIFLPLVLFKLGKILFGSEKKALLLAIFSLVPFPLQALGGLTLPISLGFLTFIFALWLWLEYWHQPNKFKFWLAIIFSLFMGFGYSLFAVYIWLFVAAGYANQVLKDKNLRVKTIATVCYLLFAICYLPLIELLTHTSAWPAQWDAVRQIKSLLVQFSGWNVVFPKPYDVASGNIIFNQAPAGLATSGVWVFPVLFLVWLATAYGAILTWKKRFEKSWGAFLFLGISVFGGYIISWYFLDGEHNFARRLDPLLAILILLFFCIGVWEFFQKRQFSKIYSTIGIFVFAWVLVGTFSTGPDLHVPSTSAYVYATRIWDSEIRLNSKNYCVLGNTEDLLVLEGISGRSIIGGGFPMDRTFGQPERVKLWNEIRIHSTKELIERALQETGAEHCWIMDDSPGGYLKKVFK